MRWCKNCDKVSTGWPMRCRYCGVGLDGRLCPRNHVNPTDPQLIFCGECGEPLEKKCGAGFSMRTYAVALFVLVVTGSLSSLALLFFREAPMFSVLLALVILLFGFRLAMQILPPSVRNFIGLVFKGLGTLLYSLLFSTGNKG